MDLGLLEILKKKINEAKQDVRKGNLCDQEPQGISKSLFDIVASEKEESASIEELSIKTLCKKLAPDFPKNKTLPKELEERTNYYSQLALYYKGLSLVAEILVYKNDIQPLKQFFSECNINMEWLLALQDIKNDSEVIKEAIKTTESKFALDKTTRLDQLTSNAVEAIKAQIGLVIHFLEVFHYNVGKHDTVEHHLLLSQKIMENIHSEKISHCFGTFARVYYARGCILRKMYSYKKAEQAFSDSIYFSFQRLDKKLSSLDFKDPNNQTIKEEVNLISYSVARVLSLGLAFILLKQGYLQRSANCVATAIIMFQQTKDTVYSTFAQLIQGCILRSKSGYNNPDKLIEAIVLLEKCEKTFSNFKHTKYELRASYELGVCWVQYLEAIIKNLDKAKISQTDFMEKFKKAETSLKKVHAEAERTQDYRWMANSKIALSNLYLLDGDCKGTGKANLFLEESKTLQNEQLASYSEALGYATAAVSHVINPEQTSCLISGYVAQGKSLIKLSELTETHGNLEYAREIFFKALEKSSENPRKTAICKTFLAQISYKQGLYSKAQEYMEEITNILENIEDPIIKMQAEQMRENLKKNPQVLVIDPKDKNLDYNKHEETLRNFLLKIAEEKTTNQVELSKILGVSRATVNRWQAKKDFSQKKK